MSWSAQQYSKFENERNRPIFDLLAHVKTETVRTCADIGCGPGNSTELLRDRYPEARIMGMDSSEDMITAARKRMPDTHFELADISTWEEKGPYDVILANAALQWVPDHENLFPFLINKLSPGGSLAVQMPDNFDEPSHRLMREVASAGPWRDKLAESSKRVARETANWYYETLKHTVSKLDVWRTTYYHQLAGGADAVVEWFKGTGLQPFLNPLNENERLEFIGQYKTAISKAYKIYADGTVLLPFPRLFIIARR
ncbi:MAG TPA: trans-aconitate 2-methyltransferase [Puia sp.]|jgi:trans-aconitate 2-methyltransferase|nr:trans-aconitate 2-methyltransferase [Puia sp.]